MRVHSKPSYSWPVLTGFALLVLTFVGVRWDVRRSQREALEELTHTAGIINHVLAGSVKSETRRGRIRKWRLRAILDNLINVTDLKMIEIAQGGKVILRAGSENERIPERCHESDKGQRLTEDAFYYWTPVSLGRCPMEEARQSERPWGRGMGRRMGREPPDATDDEDVSFSENGQILALGLGLRDYQRHVLASRQRTTVFGIASSLAIVVLIVFWIASIKQYGLREDLRRAKQHNEQLEVMSFTASGLAHEIKNPLSIINGIAQSVLRDERLSPCHENADKILDQSDLAMERLGRFLNYAKITPPKITSVKLKPFIDRIDLILRPDFQDMDVTLRTTVEDIAILTDQDLLTQMLVNLLLNSLQASEAGDAVTVSVATKGKRARLTVKDQGCGIPLDLLDDIFKPYVSGRSDGHGIGLSVVKRIVDELDWTIAVESTVGEGTEIRVDSIRLGEDDHGD